MSLGATLAASGTSSGVLLGGTQGAMKKEQVEPWMSLPSGQDHALSPRKKIVIYIYYTIYIYVV